MISAACHCGAISIAILRKPTVLTECTCSICRRYGAQWAYYTRKSVRLQDPGARRIGYRWGDRTIEFCHCSVCGCVTHYEDLDPGPDARFAVNARMLEPAVTTGLPVRLFDGADTWKYLRREARASAAAVAAVRCRPSPARR